MKPGAWRLVYVCVYLGMELNRRLSKQLFLLLLVRAHAQAPGFLSR
jgi:hypothetical protein